MRRSLILQWMLLDNFIPGSTVDGRVASQVIITQVVNANLGSCMNHWKIEGIFMTKRLIRELDPAIPHDIPRLVSVLPHRSCYSRDTSQA